MALKARQETHSKDNTEHSKLVWRCCCCRHAAFIQHYISFFVFFCDTNVTGILNNHTS